MISIRLGYSCGTAEYEGKGEEAWEGNWTKTSTSRRPRKASSSTDIRTRRVRGREAGRGCTGRGRMRPATTRSCPLQGKARRTLFQGAYSRGRALRSTTRRWALLSTQGCYSLRGVRIGFKAYGPRGRGEEQSTARWLEERLRRL